MILRFFTYLCNHLQITFLHIDRGFNKNCMNFLLIREYILYPPIFTNLLRLQKHSPNSTKIRLVEKAMRKIRFLKPI